MPVAQADLLRGKGMAMRKFLSFSFLITQAPIFVAILGVGLLNWTYSRSLSDTRDAVAHSLQVNGAISAVLSQVQDIEVGQRGYLLTRDAGYLEPYERSLGAVSGTVAELQALVSDNAVQAAHVAELNVLVGEKLAEIDTTVQLAQAGREAEAMREVKSNRGKVIMDKLRGLVASMRQEEEALLLARTGAMQKTEGRALLMVLAGLTFTVIARIVSGFLGNRLSDRPPRA